MRREHRSSIRKNFRACRTARTGRPPRVGLQGCVDSDCVSGLSDGRSWGRKRSIDWLAAPLGRRRPSGRRQISSTSALFGISVAGIPHLYPGLDLPRVSQNPKMAASAKVSQNHIPTQMTGECAFTYRVRVVGVPAGEAIRLEQSLHPLILRFNPQESNHRAFNPFYWEAGIDQLP